MILQVLLLARDGPKDVAITVGSRMLPALTSADRYIRGKVKVSGV
jgi:hypothetical protein